MKHHETKAWEKVEVRIHLIAFLIEDGEDGPSFPLGKSPPPLCLQYITGWLAPVAGLDATPGKIKS
jgi:hypothetical protein